MKTIHEILIIIKRQFLYDIEMNLSYVTGLCATANDAKDEGLITKNELNLFIQYLHDNAPKRIRDTKCNTIIKHEKGISLNGYLWQLHDLRSRQIWLTRHINLTDGL